MLTDPPIPATPFFFSYLLLNACSTRKHLDKEKLGLKLEVLSPSRSLHDPRDKQLRFTYEKTILSICGEVEDFISLSAEFQTPTNE